MSILGVNDIVEKVYQNTYNHYNTDMVSGTSFLEKLSNVKEKDSFENMWKSRFPGAYYHVMDAYKIPQNVWEREDFPFEKFFQDEVDNSVLNWKPSGEEPAMTDPKVQNRLNSTLGQNSIVVPPALEEKLKNNPALADKIMKNIDYLFAWNGYPAIPDGNHSALIVLDENGEVIRWRLTSGGGLVGPTEEEQRQFKAEQKKKAERKAEYMRILEESSIKRAEMEHNQYQKNLRRISANKVLVSAYEKNIMFLWWNEGFVYSEYKLFLYILLGPLQESEAASEWQKKL